MSDILVVNSGSSSLKYQLIDMTTERTLASGLIERIGEHAGRAVHTIPWDEVPSVERTDAPSTTERELPIAVTLALAVPAGERMDFVVEKATELGVAAIQPLLSERSVLRLAGERADRRQAHWQAIASAASEQCGRNRVPSIRPVRPLAAWLADLGPTAAGDTRLLLGWREARPWPQAIAGAAAALTLLSGPEGGFTESEEDGARLRGFVATQLGPRVLRADTAPLAGLAAIALRSV